MPTLQPTAPMSIGDVARAAGLSVPTLRYYERCGLLARPPRTPGGLRRYPPSVLPRLQFIEQAKALGLSLADIRELVGLSTGSQCACRSVLATIDRQLAAVERQLTALAGTRRALAKHRPACVRALTSNANPSCPTLDLLERTATQAERGLSRRHPGARCD